MSTTKTIKLLEKHTLRPTKNRIKVLNAFMGTEHALGHSDIELSLDTSMDRVTLYRTLNSFIEKGILHKITDNSGQPHFALCHTCNEAHHHDDHVHFKCVICEELVCLEQTAIEIPALPTGYQMNTMKVVLEGKCPECN